MRHLICYDITEDAARSTVADMLLAVNAVRVNKSVFEVSLSARELSDVLQRIAPLLDVQTDTLHCYPLCMRCFVGKISLPEVHETGDTVRHI